MSGSNVCAICLEALDTNTANLPCAHTFHSQCLVDHLLKDKKKRCPLCRAFPADSNEQSRDADAVYVILDHEESVRRSVYDIPVQRVLVGSASLSSRHYVQYPVFYRSFVRSEVSNY